MMFLLKLAIIIIIAHYIYQYYKKSYSPEAIALKEEDLIEFNKRVNATRDKWIYLSNYYCDHSVGLPTGTIALCKATIPQVKASIDFVQVQKGIDIKDLTLWSQIGMENFYPKAPWA